MGVCTRSAYVLYEDEVKACCEGSEEKMREYSRMIVEQSYCQELECVSLSTP